MINLDSVSDYNTPLLIGFSNLYKPRISLDGPTT